MRGLLTFVGFEEWLADRLARQAGMKGKEPLSPKVGAVRGEAPTQVVALAPGSSKWFVVPGLPIAKPRGTQSDKWKTDGARDEKRRTRSCVKRYHDWVNEARRCAGQLPTNPQRLDVIAYFPLTKKAKHGLPHVVRPDSDNILKAVADGLFPKNDAMIHEMRIKKRYDDGNGPRVEITIY